VALAIFFSLTSPTTTALPQQRLDCALSSKPLGV
jgi:hypothetical protein